MSFPGGDRMEAEQAAALFKNVALAVLAASGGAVMLAAQLARAGVIDGMKGALWALSIISCALVHLILRHLYLASTPRDRHARRWMHLFTAISLAEGVGWGWATLWLVGPPHLEAQLLVMAVAISIASASIPAFSPYLPALYCFFIPTTVPCAVASLLSQSPLRQIIGPMMLLFIVAVSTLGFMASRNFRAFVHLRFQAADLAADLQVQKEIADKANLAKSSFLAAASHDLRQPVHAMTLFIGALRGIAMPREGERLVAQIEASAAAMDMLFGALLDISRLDAGVVDVRPQAFALQPLLERVRLDHHQEAAAKGVELSCRPTRAWVETDPVLVERILRNLISNAVRYTPRGRVLIGCRRSPFRVEVCDTGPGIALADRTRIFEEYFQLENPERDRTKGLGLGLAIVRRLSDLLGSQLTLTSQPGRGSCFSMTLPRAAARATLPASSSEQAEAILQGRLIAVIDDESAIREAMSALLTGWNHEVVTAGSGEELVERLTAQGRSPDLIVCDYRLQGGETGVNVIGALRARFGADTPALLITGDTAPDRLAEAQASGLVLLHKPVPNGRLRAAISNLLRQSTSQPSRDLALI